MDEQLKLTGKHARTVDLDAWIDEERKASVEFKSAYDEARKATELARSLANLRKRHGLTQKELAQKLGTSQQAVSRLEHPHYHGHSIRMLARYAKALGARVEFRLIEDVSQ